MILEHQTLIKVAQKEKKNSKTSNSVITDKPSSKPNQFPMSANKLTP